MSTNTARPDLLSPDCWDTMIKMSLSKFFILYVLQQQELHGYDIAKEIKRHSNGGCAPSEGTVYPVMKQFSDGGIVTHQSVITSGRRRKIYSITDKGRQAFQVSMKEWAKMALCLQECSCLVAE
ncbi:PadR family transcriptional regulator [Leisingera sp. F5]|uniref:PadR family transcriptional regulator n=1 Tax=Leisingera sp. F5 TaxID=1813816 RepID=UPI000B224FDD|nr:PadR family transcriptional regulator [Leisingera sp. F5]